MVVSNNTTDNIVPDIYQIGEIIQHTDSTMADSPSVDPRWASTDLRWRGNASSSSLTSPRGYVEDYGDDERNNKGLMTGPQLWIWRLRNITCSIPLVSAVAVAVSVVSIEFIDDNWVVTFASFCTIFIAILLLVQRLKVRRLGTLKHQNNEIRRQVHYMRQERERLHRSLDRLDEQVADLQSVPQELHKLTKNRNVDRLIEIIHEQKILQEKMRGKINQQVMQQIMSLVVRVDRDQNWTLRPTEIEALIVRLGLVENIEFDEQRFRQMLTHDPSVSSIMQIIRSLLERDDEYQHGRPIFKLKT